MKIRSVFRSSFGILVFGLIQMTSYQGFPQKTLNNELNLGDSTRNYPIDFSEPNDHYPEFPGWEKYFSDNMIYPKIALENNIQGTVLVKIEIDSTGKISNSELLKDIGGGCGEEAIDLIRKMPNWRPGTMNGRPVAMKLIIPVKFSLLEYERQKKK